MKSIILQTILILLIIGTAFSQTENFEDETNGSTSFTLEGLNFTTTGDLFVEVLQGLGCQSDGYLGSGTTNGGSTGSFGSIKMTNPEDAFTISTTSSWCALTSSNDGITAHAGDVKFIGTLSTGGTIEETITVVPVPPAGWVDITFSSGIWEGQELTELEVSIASNINYLALDNIVFNDIISNVDDIQEEAIKIVPNPAVGEIEIIGVEAVDVKIIDAFGRIVKEQSSFHQKIDISELIDGIYYISINTYNQQITKRIIKH